jgi:hypothetical protein
MGKKIVTLYHMRYGGGFWIETFVRETTGTKHSRHDKLTEGEECIVNAAVLWTLIYFLLVVVTPLYVCIQDENSVEKILSLTMAWVILGSVLALPVYLLCKAIDHIEDTLTKNPSFAVNYM